VPGLAVGRDGVRLGRGGGSYDRALGRVPVGTFTCVVLNDSEVLDAVPADAHDRPVRAAATEERLLRFPVG
jgi:5-formyltetrahydrofolate cyclo-ligase